MESLGPKEKGPLETYHWWRVKSLQLDFMYCVRNIGQSISTISLVRHSNAREGYTLDSIWSISELWIWMDSESSQKFGPFFHQSKYSTFTTVDHTRIFFRDFRKRDTMMLAT